MPRDDTHAGLGGDQPTSMDMEPHLATSGPADTYVGVIRLRGALAEVKPSCLFVSAMEAGQNRPACSTKLDLGDEAVGQTADGERVVPFVLGACNVIEHGVELQVWYDLDGFVDTKEEGSVIRRFSIERGDQAIDLVLESDA